MTKPLSPLTHQISAISQVLDLFAMAPDTETTRDLVLRLHSARHTLSLLADDTAKWRHDDKERYLKKFKKLHLTS